MNNFFDRFRKAEPPARLDPDVIVDFIFEQGLFFISVKNIGFSPAYQISVRFNRKIKGVEGTKDVNPLPLFHKLLFLPPEKEIRTFLDSSIAYFEREEPTLITVRIDFKDRSGKNFRNNIRHDLEIYKEIGYIETVMPSNSRA